MATKKAITKKSVPKKTAFYKIGGKIGKLAVGLIAGKDHLIDMADGAIESVKSTIQNISISKKAAPKKVTKTTPPKAVTKQAKPAEMKPGKPAEMKPGKPAVKKSSPSKKVSKPVPSKKATPAKKVIKKAAQKVAAKK